MEQGLPELDDLQSRLYYTFSNPSLLIQALTHSSYANEHNKRHNQRLEFLGDSVLQLIVSDFLFIRYPDMNEGELTKLRSELVSMKTLSEVANGLDIGKSLLIGSGEEKSGGRTRDSNMGCALEAIIGAIYLDSGFEAARKAVLALLEEEISSVSCQNFKGKLQELCLKQKLAPDYRVMAQSGPSHKKMFTVELNVGGVFCLGTGKSKKSAEQIAARQMLELLEYDQNWRRI